jgi:hypothetical protein
MLFLAVLAFAITLLNFIPSLKRVIEMPLIVYFPVLTAGASLVVASAFPRPTFWTAFLKLFLGGLLTLGIFSIVSAAVGTASFMFLSDWIWEGGVAVWNWAGTENIAAGIMALLFYMIAVSIVFGIIFAALFALTNFLVLLVMNAIASRKEEAEQPLP